MTGVCSNSKMAGCGGLADLAVTAVGADKLAYVVGEMGAVTVTVKNQGQKASGASSALVALNINALLGAPYDPVTNQTGYIGLTVAIKALAPGESVTVKETFVVPDFLGKFYLFGVADIDKQVEESNENNNQLKADAQVSIASQASLKPDLTVTAISGDKSAYVAGEIGNVTITVKNAGQQPSAPSSALAALSLTAVLGSPYDPVTNPSGYGAMAIAIKGLAPGESVTVKQAFTVPDLPATYYLIGVADTDKQVDESNESNNEFKAAQQVTIASAPVLKPDLTVTAISGDKTSYIVGELGNVSITVKNAGQKASAPSNALAALSPTAVLGTPYDPVSNPSGYGAMTIPIKGLAPGESVTVKQSFTVPDLPATYYLIGVADTDKLIDESNENNNQFKAAQQVTIASGPDLVPTEVKLSQTTLVAEEPATAYVTVKNAGGSPSPKTTVVAALAFNSVLTKPYDPNTNPKGDAMLAIEVAALAPGQSVQVAANFVVPNLPGSYYLIAKADYDQVVVESKENNNELLASGKITIVPPKSDLVVYGMTFSTASLVPGSNATVSATVKNNGKGASTPSELLAALGRKPALGALYDPATNPTGDLGLLIAVKALAPGEAVQVSASFVVPDVPAVYFGLAMADYKNVVAESNEANNTHTAPGQYAILSQPDLVPSNLSMPTALYQGQQATASCTISNYGGLSAAPTKVLFVLAKTATLASPYDWLSNPNGYLAAEGTVGALSGGQSLMSSINFTVPPLPGSYYFFVLADYGNTVSESNESNNTAIWSTKVTIY
jgi:subtilase family serine protease